MMTVYEEDHQVHQTCMVDQERDRGEMTEETKEETTAVTNRQALLFHPEVLKKTETDLHDVDTYGAEVHHVVD